MQHHHNLTTLLFLYRIWPLKEDVSIKLSVGESSCNTFDTKRNLVEGVVMNFSAGFRPVFLRLAVPDPALSSFLLEDRLLGGDEVIGSGLNFSRLQLQNEQLVLHLQGL